MSFGWTKEASESYGLDLDVRQTGIVAQQVRLYCCFGRGYWLGQLPLAQKKTRKQPTALPSEGGIKCTTKNKVSLLRLMAPCRRYCRFSFLETAVLLTFRLCRWRLCVLCDDPGQIEKEKDAAWGNRLVLRDAATGRKAVSHSRLLVTLVAAFQVRCGEVR